MRRWRAALAAAVLVVAGAGGAVYAWLHAPMRLASDPVEVEIELGTAPRDVARLWVEAGVQEPALWLYEWFRWSGESRRIRAGSYEAVRGTTPAGLLRMMVRGDETLSVVRLIDGWTFRQFRAELAAADSLQPLTAGMTDAELMATIGAPGVLPEGRFHPDTYSYSKGSTDVAVLRRAYRAMAQRLDAVWQARSPDTPLRSADEALVLASIVEKETGVAADRGKIAGVFINRLRAGMPLQTDPTVIYGLGGAFDGTLKKRDLLADTPFNTYTRGGLPPTPIAMPGNASLLAAVRPEATRALLTGFGAQLDDDTLAAHNRAVAKYQRAR